MGDTVPLSSLAREIRSKNAGPFLITPDIMFANARAYARVRAYITQERVAKLYGIPRDEVVKISYCDPIKGIKVTILRRTPSGSVEDTDVYGCQQHVPLLSMKIPG